MRGRLHSHSAWAPRSAAAITALVGAVNVITALAPDIRWRRHLLMQAEPVVLIRVFHALALPAGAMLLIVSPYLLKRRRRAMVVAIAILVPLGLINILKGLDIEESLLGWIVAGLLYRGRAAFTVRHEAISLRSAIWRVPLVAIVAIVVITLADWVAHGKHDMRKILGESSALVRFKHGSVMFGVHSAHAFHHTVNFAWIPLGVHMVEIGALVTIVYLIFKPLAVPKVWASPAQRTNAVEVVRRYGSDTLAFFKLRPDEHLYFNKERSAFVGYRVEAGTMLLSGDPVGPPDRFPPLLADVRLFAQEHNLKLGAVGASKALLPLYQGLGLRALYLGDEAIIELDQFSLEGRAIRKVRQSVTRLQREGFTAEVLNLAEIEPSAMEEVERVMQVGRIGGSERGFSMGMEGIRCACEQDTVLTLARDSEGSIRGLLHFVPCYGRAAVSLSLMRRDPETPNGLMEFLVVASVEGLRERGISEMSLNFAALSKYLREPEGSFERLLGRIASMMNPYFQIESLYRFNVKFFPRWDPRYLVYEGRLGIPRTGLAAIWAEGLVAKPTLPDLGAEARLGQRALKIANR